MLKASSVFLVLLLSAAVSHTDVVLSGTAKSCFLGQPLVVPGVKVAAFQVSSVRPLVSLLQVMDTLTIADADTSSFSRFAANYSQMISMDTTTTALARATSAQNGSFSLTVPAVDSVVVVGYAEFDEDPFFYSYALLPGNSNTTFTLDMAGGRCGH